VSDTDESPFDAVERLLADRAGLPGPPGHRDRVLAAVRDTLTVNAEDRGPLGQAGKGLDPGSVAALAAIALSTMLAVVAPWLAVASPVAPPRPEPRIEHRIVAQARAVGIELPVEWLAATSRQPVEPVLHPGESPSARFHDAWRLRALLSGEL
jgi:hypothetical protein